MDTASQETIFEIKLNDTGRLYIRKVFTTVRILVFIGAIVSLVQIAANAIAALHTDFFWSKSLAIRRIGSHMTIIVYSVLFLLHLYFLKRTSDLLKDGVDYNDNTSFNQSFRALYRSCLYGVATGVISLPLIGLDFWLIIKAYLQR